MHCNLPSTRIVGAILLLLQFLSADAFWRLLCDGSVGLARIDPLVNLGKVSEHVHTIKGGSGKILSPSGVFFPLAIPLCHGWDRLGPARCTSHISIAVSDLFRANRVPQPSASHRCPRILRNPSVRVVP